MSPALIAEPTRAVPYLPPPGFWQIVRRDLRPRTARFSSSTRSRPASARRDACSPASTTASFPTSSCSARHWAAASCRLPPCSRGQSSTSAATGRSGTTRTRRTRSRRAAALTTIEIIEDERLVENAARVGAFALERLAEMRARIPAIGDVRGRGLLLGIELVRDRATRSRPTTLAEAVLYAALTRGLSFKITMGNVLTLTPPLTVTKAICERARYHRGGHPGRAGIVHDPVKWRAGLRRSIVRWTRGCLRRAKHERTRRAAERKRSGPRIASSEGIMKSRWSCPRL